VTAGTLSHERTQVGVTLAFGGQTPPFPSVISMELGPREEAEAPGVEGVVPVV
jgi:hypothetical protein